MRARLADRRRAQSCCSVGVLALHQHVWLVAQPAKHRVPPLHTWRHCCKGACSPGRRCGRWSAPPGPRAAPPPSPLPLAGAPSRQPPLHNVKSMVLCFTTSARSRIGAAEAARGSQVQRRFCSGGSISVDNGVFPLAGAYRGCRRGSPSGSAWCPAAPTPHRQGLSLSTSDHPAA